MQKWTWRGVAAVAIITIGVVYLFQTYWKDPTGAGRDADTVLKYTGERAGDDVRDERDSRLPADEWSHPDDHPSMVFFREVAVRKQLPTYEELKKMSEKELNYIYNGYLDNTDFHCNRQIRLGVSGDGGYETCDDIEYRPIRPCLVYSFGIRNDFSFDDDVGKLYGCDVHSFDPSMRAQSHRRSARVVFHNMGLGGKAHKTSVGVVSLKQQKGWVIQTLSETKIMLNHEGKTLDILKMDIEASEWVSLQDILDSGELKLVRQLFIEFHIYEKEIGMLEKVHILQRIEALGFRRFRTTNHFWRKSVHNDSFYPVDRGNCYEMGFVNVNLKNDAV